MNDRYLFKAKRIDNGEWVQGNLLGSLKRLNGISEKMWLIHNPYDDEKDVVDPTTICQCTGLKDKEKNLIWENDLVLTPREDGYSLICWNDTEARWEMYNETEGIVLDFDNYWANEIEVVGNKFDNPELLEVE